MKAQTFLEWYKEFMNRPEVGFDLKGAIDRAKIVKGAVDFYSRPFRPELITELFEEWGYSEAKQKYVTHDKFGRFQSIEFRSLFNNTLCFQHGTGNTEYRVSYPFPPKTIDRFIEVITEIAESINREIPLEWKPEIIKEVFQ